MRKNKLPRSQKQKTSSKKIRIEEILQMVQKAYGA